jgi:hypothetical protein
VVVIAVILNDKGIPYEQAGKHFRSAAAWARKHCKSFITYEIMDVADFSIDHDLLCEYQFGDDRDAVIFQLRWK